MLAHQQKSKAIHLCSSSPTIKMHARRNSTGDPEFDFWGSRKTLCHESFGDHFNSGSTELEFQAEANTEDGFGVCSPPLWKTSRSKSNKQESSPLLPHNHHYSNLSPNSRRQAIADGRKELMEMIQDLPESCYELSLKDIVADQHSLQGEEESIVSKDEAFDFNSETQITKLKKKKMNMNTNIMKRGQITRTGSMESETFLIKMFLPSSLGSKKKAKASRVPSINSSEQPENDVDKVWWIKGFPIPGRRKKICRSSTNGSTSSSNSSSSGSSRYVSESDFMPGCWSFFPAKKSKSMRERGCIF
ncbi:hypothetical protein TorRG33x02_226650 [Trema orientale]|uniref:Uncharacterized protein n=1 Tax=Trema orientale TaxID=63057 RepID=A0A2P5E7M8_TREOI|nr:hypothetical protein TorRG33x02_226650 [Trema orientale]